MLTILASTMASTLQKHPTLGPLGKIASNPYMHEMLVLRWIEYGKRFRPCMCLDKNRGVILDMKPFIKKYQPARLKDWIKGVDIGPHPEDSIETKEVLKFCLNTLKVLAEKNEGNAMEEGEYKKKELQQLCSKQIDELKNYRKILPEIKNEMYPEMYPEEKFEMKQEEEFEIEKVLRKKIKLKKTYYLIQWKGWKEKDSTWEPSHFLEGHVSMFQLY